MRPGRGPVYRGQADRRREALGRRVRHAGADDPSCGGHDEQGIRVRVAKVSASRLSRKGAVQPDDPPAV
jgi:hypothetical protein